MVVFDGPDILLNEVALLGFLGGERETNDVTTRHTLIQSTVTEKRRTVEYHLQRGTMVCHIKKNKFNKDDLQ